MKTARHAFLGEVILVHSKLWDNKVFQVLASSGRSPQQDYETWVPIATGQLCGYLLLHTALTSLTFGLLIDKAGERAGRKIWVGGSSNSFLSEILLHEFFKYMYVCRYLMSPSVTPGGSVVKDPPADARDAGDTGSIPGLRRSPAGGTGNLLQYSWWGNPMVRGAGRATVHGVAESQIHLRDWAHTHTHLLNHPVWNVLMSNLRQDTKKNL